MRALLLVIGLVVTAAGAAVGVLSFLRPGDVVFGLDLGLAGTLLVGGLIIIALAEVIGAVSRLARAFEHEIGQPAVEHIDRPEPAIGTAAAGAAVAAAGAVVAAQAGSERETGQDLDIGDVTIEKAGDGSVVVTDTLGESAAGLAQEAADTLEPPPEPGSVAARISEIAADVKAAANNQNTLESDADDLSEEIAEAVAETADEVADAAEQTAGTSLPSAASAAVAELQSIAGRTNGALAPQSEPEFEATSATEPEESIDVAQATPALDAEPGEEAEPETEEEAGTDAEVEAEAEPEDEAEAETEDEAEAETEDEAEAETEDEAEAETEDEAEAETEDEAEIEAEAEVEAEPELEEHTATTDGDGQTQPDTMAPPDGALYVVEETSVRDRPARVLSDGTVEAETDAGWMRFENMEHLNEYLDAMSA